MPDMMLPIASRVFQIGSFLPNSEKFDKESGFH